MFGIGMPEMLLLLAVALIVFGPKKLPELAKSMGRALGEFKRATSDIKDSIEEQTGLGEVRDTLNDVQKDIKAQVDLGAAEADKADAESTADGDQGPLSSVKNAFDALNADAPKDAAASDTAERPSDDTPDSDQDSNKNG